MQNQSTIATRNKKTQRYRDTVLQFLTYGRTVTNAVNRTDTAVLTNNFLDDNKHLFPFLLPFLREEFAVNESEPDGDTGC